MNGLWLQDLALSLRKDLPLPEPAAGEALIKISLAGICGTDLEMLRGYYPFTGVLGHEFVGVVVSDPGAPELAGQRVTGEITIACGECDSCHRGQGKHCLNSRTLGIRNYAGVFADYCVLPIRNLHAVPAGVGDLQAVFTEPLAAALEILDQVHILPTDRVLVIGAGRLGLLAARVLALTGCRLAVVARQARSIEILTGWGIPTVEAAGLAPASYDVVVEATGSADGLQQAAQVVRPRGTIVLKSTYHGDITFNISAMVVNEVTLVGSRCGPFDAALRLLDERVIDPSPMVMGTYPLERGLEAFELARQRGVLKVLIRPGAA